MFRLRIEQKEAFRRQALSDFEDRVVDHLQRCFPDRYQALGDAAIRAIIRQGIEGAATYGVVAERDVCTFIDLMLVLGVGFDHERDWAVSILTAPSPKDPSEKLRLLHECAMERA